MTKIFTLNSDKKNQVANTEALSYDIECLNEYFGDIDEIKGYMWSKRMQIEERMSDGKGNYYDEELFECLEQADELLNDAWNLLCDKAGELEKLEERIQKAS